MQIAIIDDEEKDRIYLSQMIHNWFSESGIPAAHITTYKNGEAFVQDFYKGKYDLIFLDIYMDKTDGVETAKTIRQTDKAVKLVFVTVSNDYASENYVVAASYYLRKPFYKRDFRQMMNRLHFNEPEQQKNIMLPNGQSLPLKSIAYSSFSGHYVTVQLISDEQLRIRCSQKEWESLLLPFPDFILCTKGMIVNLEEVERLEATIFIMKNNAYIPISRRKYPKTKQAYSNFLIKKARNSREEIFNAFTI